MEADIHHLSAVLEPCDRQSISFGETFIPVERPLACCVWAAFDAPLGD